MDSYRRNASRQKALEAWTREFQTSPQPSPELQNEVCACLQGTLNGLKPEYAEILRAVDLQQQPLHAFAQQHSLSASNAGVRIHRARAALRKRLLQTCTTCAEHACLNCTCKKQAHSPERIDR
jgi:RNA polymerase sigma-70 factor (ECF subfamily)